MTKLVADEGMIILCSDEVADSFASSEDLAIFINSIKTKNPQVMSDEILNKTFLIVPTRKGYKFVGWFDDDGNEITTVTNFTQETTIHAKWEQDSLDNTKNSLDNTTILIIVVTSIIGIAVIGRTTAIGISRKKKKTK